MGTLEPVRATAKNADQSLNFDWRSNMKITSVLLGAAAALSIVSGAQAADAIVAAAPEPMDYVKVCDAFGTGYFYIPGTETCLKIGGLVRYDLGFAQGDSYFSTSKVRGRLEVSSANDTEYGKAYSFLRIDADNDNNTSAALAGYFYAGIGGLEFGTFDNQWAKFFGYGVGPTDWGGDYIDWNNGNRQYISYTADMGSAKAYISLENDGETTNFTPDVSGGVSADFGGASGAFGVGYDTSNSTYALKAVVRGKAGTVDLGLMGLYSSGAGNSYNGHEGWGVIGGVSAPVSEKVTAGLTVQYFQNAGAVYDKSAGTTIGGNVTWNVASGFMAFVEVYHEVDAKKTSGFLRLERSF